MINVRIIHDEREHAQIGKCENCGKDGVRGRRVEAFGVAGESRGYYFICFDCEKPKITWSKDGRIRTTPAIAFEKAQKGSG